MVLPKNEVSGSECLELGVPWQVEGSIIKEDEVLTKDDIVLEVGSGGSTVFYATRCKKVISIETDLSYYKQVINRLSKDRVNNIDYAFIDREDQIIDYISYIDDKVTVISVDPIVGFNRSVILNEILKKKFDLRIIIMDNYGSKELFPLHYDKPLDLPGWEMFEYNHPEWWGNGTRLYIKNNYL